MKNKGVGYVITPAWKSKIPAALLKEVTELGKDIADGWVPAN